MIYFIEGSVKFSGSLLSEETRDKVTRLSTVSMARVASWLISKEYPLMTVEWTEVIWRSACYKLFKRSKTS